MRQIFLLFLILFPQISWGEANSNNSLPLEEEQNGANAGRYRILQFSNGTTTNNNDGSIYINNGGSGGGNLWSLTGNNLYPTTIANNVGIGTITTSDSLTIQTSTGGITNNFVPSGQGGIDANTVLMIQLNNSAVDTSSNAFTITNNNVTFSNVSYPYTSQIYTGVFNGTNGTIVAPSNAVYNFGSGNFTIDFWAKSSTSNSTRMDTLIIGDPAFTNNAINFDLNDTAACYVAIKSSSGRHDISNGSTGAYTDATWRHFALVRNGATISFYMNGTAVNTSAVSTSTFNFSSNTVQIGTDANGHLWNGNIAGFRISNIARWTSNFTPPALPYDSLSLVGMPKITLQSSGTQTASILTNGNLSNALQIGQGTGIAITIPSSQNVGIGTATPLYKLDVAGGGQFSKGLIINGVTGPDGINNIYNVVNMSGGNAEILYNTTDGNSDQVVFSDSSGMTGPPPQYAPLALWSIGINENFFGSAIFTFFDQQTGQSALTLHPSTEEVNTVNNVLDDGVGGMIASQTLEVNTHNNSNTLSFVVNDSNGNDAFQINNSDPSTFGDYVRTINTIVDDGSGNVANNAINSDNSGNVNVGETGIASTGMSLTNTGISFDLDAGSSGQQPLTVNSGTILDDGFGNMNTAGTISQSSVLVCLQNGSQCPSFGTGTVTSVVAGTGLTGGTITTSGTVALDLTHANTWTGQQIFNTANVGINTSIPGQKLDVSGNIRVVTGVYAATQASPPTIASNACGSSTQGTVNSNSTDLAGSVTTGTSIGSLLSCAISFGQSHTTAPAGCVCNDQTTPLALAATATSSAVTCTSLATVASGTISYQCQWNKP